MSVQAVENATNLHAWLANTTNLPTSLPRQQSRFPSDGCHYEQMLVRLARRKYLQGLS